MDYLFISSLDMLFAAKFNKKLKWDLCWSSLYLSNWGKGSGGELAFAHPPAPTASLLIKVTLDHSGHLHVYVEDIGNEHLNHGIFVLLVVLLNDGHGFCGVVSLLLLESILNLILLGLHFLAEYLLLGQLVLVDLFLGQFLNRF